MVKLKVIQKRFKKITKRLQKDYKYKYKYKYMDVRHGLWAGISKKSKVAEI